MRRLPATFDNPAHREDSLLYFSLNSTKLVLANALKLGSQSFKPINTEQTENSFFVSFMILSLVRVISMSTTF